MLFYRRNVNKIKCLFKIVRKYEIMPELVAILLTLNSYLMIEMQLSGYFVKERISYILLNLLIIYIVYLFLITLCPHGKAALIIGNILFMLYIISQYLITECRGIPWQISDLNSSTLKGGAEVAGGYSFQLNLDIYFEILFTILLCIIVGVFKFEKIHVKRRIACLTVCILFFVFGGNQLQSVLDNAILRKDVDFYNRNQPYMSLGHILMFTIDVFTGNIEKPQDYSDKRVGKIIKENTTTNISGYDTINKDSPNIIAIMDESFADFNHLTEDRDRQLKTNEDYMPFVRGMSENTIKGYVTVTAYGGYSCNSEYEFLTGNTMGLLPVGSTAYTEFMDNNQPSLVSQLNSYGYTTIGLSGAESSIWNLKNAYDKLEFNKKIYYDTLKNDPNLKEYRDYVSDEYMFSIIESQLKNKDSDEKLFIFNTTMQNHGGYSNTHLGDIKILDSDLSKTTRLQAETYLGSIKKTDEAVDKLIDYLKNYDEKVVVVFFGDHYPHIPELFENEFGKDISDISLKEVEKMHQTPFFIWANYDIQEKKINSISLNYLGGLLMNTAGMKQSGYQRYLSKLYEVLPVISGFGYEDKNGNVYSYGGNKYRDQLNEYNILEYNNMFGNRVNNFFD